MSNLLDTLLTRREAFKVGASLVSAYWFLPLLEPTNVYAQSKVNPRGSARFVIFVMLEGGQSHVDSWDLKEGYWTPHHFDIHEIAPGVTWPMALFPQLAKQRERGVRKHEVRRLDQHLALGGREQGGQRGRAQAAAGEPLRP